MDTIDLQKSTKSYLSLPNYLVYLNSLKIIQIWRGKVTMKKFFKFGCLGIIAIVVIIIIIAVASSGGNKSDAPKKVTSNGSTTNSTQTQAPKEFKVGDTIQLGDDKVTVTKVDKSAGDDMNKPKQGNEFVIVSVTIENDGKNTIDYNPLDFKIKNSQGNITDETFTTINSDTALNSGQLSAGGKVSGTLAFEAPQNDPKLQLIFNPSFWSDKNITINLQ
jgi:hypothetical protein